MNKGFWQRQCVGLRTTATLAAWRWRKQWFLLLVTGLGILIATTLVCTLPLFSSVMVTAGLRATLRSVPDSTDIQATVGVNSITSAGLNQATHQVTSLLKGDLASSLNAATDLDQQIEVSGWSISGNDDQVVVTGASMHDVASHLQVLQGRLPSDQSTALDVVMTQSAATYMGVKLGSTIRLLNQIKMISPDANAEPQIHAQAISVQVVGIFQTMPDDAYWYDQPLQELPPTQGGPAPFHILMSSDALLHLFDTFSQQYQTSGLYLANSCQVFLSYALAPEQLRGDKLDELISSLGQLQADASRLKSTNQNGFITFPYVANVSLSGATLTDPYNPELLTVYQNEVLVGQATMLILIMQITGLILFAVVLLSDALVEHQATTIALLRSRGASRGQILGALLTQGLVLCVLAGCIAPLLALGIITHSAPLFLNSASQDALNVLPHTLQALLNGIGLYWLAALLVSASTLLLSFLIALRGNIQTQRRETARSSRRPLWLRLRLDLVLALVGFGGYGFAYYAQSTQQLLDAHTQQLLLTPLNLFASVFVLLAGLLFFLRLFPVVLRLCVLISAGRRGAVSLLATAYMERAPRQSMRTALLLGLALAFMVFTLIFSASQVQHSQDLAAYQAGADFSGSLPLNLQAASVTQPGTVLARYRALPGVTEASIGYVDQRFFQVNTGSPAEYVRSLQLRAVDPQTFVQTANWSEQDSEQPLNTLLTQLVKLRPQASKQKVVPAILSQSAWQLLHLHQGATFTMLNDIGYPDAVRFLAVGSVAHIPPADESLESGMLVDFQSLFAVSQQAHEALQPDYIWLSTNDNASTLAGVRHALTTSPLSLGNLADRRVLGQTDASNPLALDLLAVLSVGVIATILLTLLANLLLPILSLRTRLTSFAFLRAIGASPGLVGRLLAWEQGLVLGTALVVGLLFGFLLTFLAVPQLIISSVSVSSAVQSNGNRAYLLQQLLPARIVLPFTLPLAVLGFLALFILALVVVVMIALRPTLSQQLRLNED